MRQPKLVYLATHPVTVDILLRGQLAFMREAGFDVTVISSPGPELERVSARESVRTIAVPMAREIDPRADLAALAALIRVFQRIRPDVVNAGTPKAGLLGMLAARATRVPIRIYLLRGLRLETASGVLRSVLATTERVASAASTHVTCVSKSLLEVATSAGYVPRSKASVVGEGSSNGVDSHVYERTEALRARGAARMRDLGIEPSARVVGFVGRFAADKGIAELLSAFEQVRREAPGTKLLLIGGDLAGDALAPDLNARIQNAPDVAVMGATTDLAPLYARMDLLAFPSHREGFPNVPLEAACAEVPVVGFRSTGVVDAIVDGETGCIVEKGDVRALARALVTYLNDEALRRRHGLAGKRRAEKLFSRRAVWESWLSFYGARLTERGLAGVDRSRRQVSWASAEDPGISEG
jgi:glycosyltransferase involved in cell wall biosynthesis